MREYLVKITKGAWDNAPCEFVIFMFQENLYVRQIFGRAPLPEEIVAIISEAPELVNIRSFAEEKAEPLIMKQHTGYSGCVDYIFRNIIKQSNDNEFHIHISMYRKFNAGFSVPLWALTAVIAKLSQIYGYSTLVEYTVEETGIIEYKNDFPCKPFTGIDEKEVEEIEEEI